MDHHESHRTTTIATHPSFLLIGDADTLLDKAITLLQKQFCPNTSCAVCIVCRKIREQQHESIIWLHPEKQYTVDDLKIIFSTISFALEPGQHFFFILQKADMLTTACANALLKSLEEPPAGYHFILLAQRAELILPTIKSRCLIEYYHTDTLDAPTAALFPFFTTTTFHDPLAFSKELDNANMSEWESMALLDRIMIHWAQAYKKHVIAQNTAAAKQAERALHHLKVAMLQPPMPGSSKLFWKNLFLQIKQL
jgi:hypothetical protein